MTIDRFPHCDQRVLHQPGECEFCDRHSEWQELREKWGIAFTGHSPGTVTWEEYTRSDGKRVAVRVYVGNTDAHQRAVLPCPADFNRPPTGEGSDHRRWVGNVATTHDTVNETAASRMMYGCHRPPRGWVCTRSVGHDGPCAAVPLSEAITEARLPPGFLERLRANMTKHKDILDRLR